MVRVVLATFPDADSAAEIVARLLEERLIACGNILPTIRSLYLWEGKVQDEAEALVIFKTMEDTLQALEERLAEFHPYEVPEIIALSPSLVHRPYSEWVRTSTGKTEPS